ncbi:hypothetical protein [Bacteroides ihuae]|uniref:hypothetical protein n=1 Tax=Bacteroides ihuae TaxID=1852362 RepID=UPI0008D9E855|nr:hypothetical protein [Bacteroides ihuae]
MLSKKSVLLISSLVREWNSTEISSLLTYVDISVDNTLSRAAKSNILYSAILQNESKQRDAIDFLITRVAEGGTPDYSDPLSLGLLVELSIDDKFCKKYPSLANSIKRDGYTIRDGVLTSLLPSELIEMDTENELFRLLDHYEFSTTKGHLEQAIQNHSTGNWAGANSQFRPFMESLLMEISRKLLPEMTCNNYGEAVILLSAPNLLNPVFLSPDLNEVPSPGSKGDKTFVSGLWKRLHPQGSHPGLSDEEDSTFRYHTLIVFARYLLKRLEDR